MSTADGPRRPIPNSYWVIPGSFAAGEYPGAKNPDEAAKKLGTLFDAGIDHFIDLTDAGEYGLLPYSGIAEQEASRRGPVVRSERHPIHDMCIPSSPAHMVSILDAIDAAMDYGKTVYVHCWGGVGRTGTVVGCWLVRHGRTGDEALDRVGELFDGMEKSPRFGSSPQTPQQIAFVRDWAEPSRKEWL